MQLSLRRSTCIVGHVSHHNIELSWNLEEQRKGPQEQWLKFSVEEEDPKLHKYGLIYTGYARQHVVEGLEPRTTYRFRLKVTDPKGESVYSSPICVTTTSEPMSGEQLHRAVSRNDLEDVIHILQGRQTVVNTLNKLGLSALMVASQKGYTSLVQVLVENGADVNLKNTSGKDSLMIACFAGHLGIVQYLRSQGASWLSRDFGGCTAMHWATDGGKTDVATILINAGANVNVKDKDGKTPLMVAALNNHEDLVALFLEKGADPDIKNEFGKGALDMAKGLNRQSVVSIIEEKKKQLSNTAVDLASSPLCEESAS
ncbi:hypothetical protein E2320_008513 [Naja naja]|nr:hypothetical protein E2320_008513 [Naja naja]